MSSWRECSDESPTVVWPVELELLDWVEPVVVTMSWSHNDPYAVGLRFPGDDGVYWLVARDLLASGLSGPAGLGDIAVFPDLANADCLELVLSSPDGAIALRIARAELAAFLDATYGHVPAGAEVQPSHFA
ncbi:SsgA family sporulation/cell division regulator [Pseudonocardia spinosispora]|uniref:SsgA family sporulation/cell division regulator n=1 Tax=Pseudonocardia spinosispora TaxID=103441 RepID=UPI000A05D0D1|nr:SsgA family sporulation/cell division regulator [Pseudonocardia spinosispora]